MRIVPPDCQKNHFRAAEGIGKRSVSRLESARQRLRSLPRRMACFKAFSQKKPLFTSSMIFSHARPFSL